MNKEILCHGNEVATPPPFSKEAGAFLPPLTIALAVATHSINKRSISKKEVASHEMQGRRISLDITKNLKKNFFS